MSNEITINDLSLTDTAGYKNLIAIRDYAKKTREEVNEFRKEIENLQTQLNQLRAEKEQLQEQIHSMLQMIIT